MFSKVLQTINRHESYKFEKIAYIYARKKFCDLWEAKFCCQNQYFVSFSQSCAKIPVSVSQQGPPFSNLSEPGFGMFPCEEKKYFFQVSDQGRITTIPSDSTYLF